MVLFCAALRHTDEASHLALVVPHVIGACAGILLLIGLWTPICGAVIAAVEAWVAFSTAGGSWIPIILATLGATLAMIGPGAWSIDARLFGRKHIEISEP